MSAAPKAGAAAPAKRAPSKRGFQKEVKVEEKNPEEEKKAKKAKKDLWAEEPKKAEAAAEEWRPISKKAVRKNGGIVKARGPTQVGDYVLKEWQRLPKQLLGEYCQKQKLPRPIFPQAKCEDPSKFRSRVVIPDAKARVAFVRSGASHCRVSLALSLRRARRRRTSLCARRRCSTRRRRPRSRPRSSRSTTSRPRCRWKRSSPRHARLARLLPLHSPRVILSLLAAAVLDRVAVARVRQTRNFGDEVLLPAVLLAAMVLTRCASPCSKFTTKNEIHVAEESKRQKKNAIERWHEDFTDRLS